MVCVFIDAIAWYFVVCFKYPGGYMLIQTVVESLNLQIIVQGKPMAMWGRGVGRSCELGTR